MKTSSQVIGNRFVRIQDLQRPIAEEWYPGQTYTACSTTNTLSTHVRRLH